MALVKTTLKEDLKRLFSDMRNRTVADDDALAEQLATAIDAYIKTADVPAGIPVTTAGSATSQAGATTATAKLV